MPEKKLEQAIIAISKHIEACGESDNALALKAGLDQTTVSRLHKRKIKNPSLGILLPLSTYLRIGLDDLTGIAKGGVMSSSSAVRSIPEPKFEAALSVARAWSELPPEWQDRIYHFVTTFDLFNRTKSFEDVLSKVRTNVKEIYICFSFTRMVRLAIQINKHFLIYPPPTVRANSPDFFCPGLCAGA